MVKFSIDITGQRFGKLVAIRPTQQRKKNTVVWECLCDCGNIFFADLNSLRRGYRKSCGCLYPQNVFYELPEACICFMNNGDYFWFSHEDFDFISAHRWSTLRGGYAGTWWKGNQRRIGRLLFGLEVGDKRVVDHINGDIRDNRRCNLRVCTNAQNIQHMGTRKTKGYCLNPRGGTWQARIKCNGKFHYLGSYATEAEARVAYLEASAKLHGDYGTHKSITWFPGYDNDDILNPKNLLDWVNFLHEKAA